MVEKRFPYFGRCMSGSIPWVRCVKVSWLLTLNDATCISLAYVKTPECATNGTLRIREDGHDEGKGMLTVVLHRLGS